MIVYKFCKNLTALFYGANIDMKIREKLSSVKSGTMTRLKHYLSLKGLLLVMVLLLLAGLFYRHTTSLFVFHTPYPMYVDPVAMESDTEYKNQLVFQEGLIQDLKIKFSVPEAVSEGTLKVVLSENDSPLQTWVLDATSVMDQKYRKFTLDQPFQMKEGAAYSLSLINSYSDAGNALSFYTSNDTRAISYGESTYDQKSFSVYLDYVDLDRQAQYQPLLILALLALLFLTILTVDPRAVKIPVCLIVLAAGFLVVHALDYELFQQLQKTNYIHDWEESQNAVTVAPSQTVDLDFQIPAIYCDTINLYSGSKIPEGLSVKLTHTEDGTVLYDGFITSDQIMGDGLVQKTAVRLYREENFPGGAYHAELTNTGSESFDISLTEDGQLNTGTSRTTMTAVKLTMIICFLLGLYLLVLYLRTRDHLSPEKWFLTTAIPMSLIYLMLFAPWGMPDTRAHMAATYRMSNILVGYDKEDWWKGRAEDENFQVTVWAIDSNPTVKGYDAILDNLHLKCTDPTPVNLTYSSPRMEYYSILNYLPQSLGLAIGRKLNLSFIVSLYLGRFLILLCYLASIYRSIKKIPGGKWILATMALLPYCLMMSGSVSYDCMVIISTLSMISCIFRLLYESREEVAYVSADYKNVHVKATYIETLFWTFLVGAVKGGGYLLLLPLSFMLFQKDKKKKSLCMIAGILAAGLVSVLIFDKLLPTAPDYQFGTQAGIKLSTKFAFQQPALYLDMVLSALITYFDQLTLMTGAATLGYLEAVVPYVSVMLFMVCGGILSVFEKDQVRYKKVYKYLYLFIIVLGLLTTPAMLLSWTDVGSHRVEGLQGRYFLPLMPLFYFAMTKFFLHTPDKENREKIAHKGILWMSLLSCFFVFVMMTFYLTR